MLQVQLRKLLSEKCTLTIATKYQLGETRLSNATADLLVPDTAVIKTTAERWWLGGGGVMRPQPRPVLSLFPFLQKCDPTPSAEVQCEQEACRGPTSANYSEYTTAGGGVHLC